MSVEGIATAKNPRTGEVLFAHPFGEPAPRHGRRRRATAAPPWPTG